MTAFDSTLRATAGVVCSGDAESFQLSAADLQQRSKAYRTSAISAACRVSDTAVRKWQQSESHIDQPQLWKEISADVVARIRQNAGPGPGEKLQRFSERLTKERVGRVISRIGEVAGIVV